MNIPTYIKNPNQENYNEELNQALRRGLSDNGWTAPQITMADLTTVAPLMPDGTIWYVINHVPPVYAGKIGGVLVQFVTAAYP